MGAGGLGGSAFAGAGMLPTDLAAAAGTPSNLGKMGDAGGRFSRSAFIETMELTWTCVNV